MRAGVEWGLRQPHAGWMTDGSPAKGPRDLSEREVKRPEQGSGGGEGKSTDGALFPSPLLSPHLLFPELPSAAT